MDLSKVYRLLTINPKDPDRYRIYYENATQPLYKYLVDNNVLKQNKDILEIGCGGGVFYEEYRSYLQKLRNRYTCIDIDLPSISISKTKVDYVDFRCLDIHDYTALRKHNVILMVQSYTCIPNIDKVLKRYFKHNRSGKVIIINTIFPEYLTGIQNICREVVIKGWFGVNWGKALTLNHMIDLSKRLKTSLRFKIMRQNNLGNDEYIFILEKLPDFRVSHTPTCRYQ